MKKIIHISDLHFRQDWQEDQEYVLKALFEDLPKVIKDHNPNDTFLIFSGDIVLAGSDIMLYNKFIDSFDSQLNDLKIPKKNRICIPGNHDVSQKFVKENSFEHHGIVSQKINENDFNTWISKPDNFFFNKFSQFQEFTKKFTDLKFDVETYTGFDVSIDNNLKLYCLNTALCSSGGYNSIDDKGLLNIDTRKLQKWIQSQSEDSIKIMVMHHPLDWLSDWSSSELKKILSNFSLCLSGHVHNQDVYHQVSDSGSFVNCSAPPLLTSKKGDLGYAIINLSSEGVDSIEYRQWTKKGRFVRGVNFANNDEGIVAISRKNLSTSSKNIISGILSKRLEDAQRIFTSQPDFWIEPILSKSNDIGANPDSHINEKVVVAEIIKNPRSYIIKAPPQFGLTSLAHHMIKESWNQFSSFWLYLDSAELKINKIDKYIKKEIESLGLELNDVKCIVLDSWANLDIESVKLLNAISNLFTQPLIVMQTMDETSIRKQQNNEGMGREFDKLYLLPLSRGNVRTIVSKYNEKRHIGDENAVVNKVVSDLEVLNIHRTPFNCLTILKVSERFFDESPVNRTKMLEMVLAILFNVDELPFYKTRPDIKDCEYVLGIFCEEMIRTNNYTFTRDSFIQKLRDFCKIKLIYLEVEVVFDILFENSILTRRENSYCFRFRYWIYYFAAQRMHHNSDFAQYIFKDKRYASFPEIIEFYTGIDRRRDDAITVLLEDIRNVCDTVQQKVGLPDEMDPYKLMQWDPTSEIIEKMKRDIGEDVKGSLLPNEVKDRYADSNYDQRKPYIQTIQNIYEEYSLLVLKQSIIASSRGLRNSDYANPELKKELLNQIVRAWVQISKVLLALTPMLAENGRVAYDGMNFTLLGDFGKTVGERINRILPVIPYNVISWFKNDIFSPKIGPLLFDKLKNENSEVGKHQLILLLVYFRPKDWKSHVQSYIENLHKNSFFLYRTFTALRSQYRFSFASNDELREIEYLILMGLAKHEYGDKKPGIDKISMVSKKFKNIMPKREANDDLD